MRSNALTKAVRTACPIVLAALLATGMLAAAGCSSTDQPSAQAPASAPTKQSAGPLKVAVQYNALSIPTVFADESGYFSDAGLDVEIFTFVNGAEENKAIEKGDVDIASDGLASVYMLASGQFSWIGESDEGSSTVGIYVREGSEPTRVSGQLEDAPDALGSADTLRGLTIAGPAGTMEEWAAVSYLSRFGLTAGTDYDFIEMDREQAVDSVINGSADVFIATDVDYCRLMEENGFVAIAKGVEATGVPFNNGYLVSNKIIETRYDDLVLFLRAVYGAAKELDDDPEMWTDFALEYYRSNGKPATREDVQRETESRRLLLPSDFAAPDYRLGSGVLDVGRFHAEIGALQADQVAAIQQSIDPGILEDAFGITVQGAVLPKEG